MNRLQVREKSTSELMMVTRDSSALSPGRGWPSSAAYTAI